MAVMVEELAAGVRVDNPDELQLAQLTRLLGVGQAYVELLIPTAPEAIQDECIVRLAAYLYDAPSTGRRDAFANAWVNSGAGSLASRWLTQQVASGGPVTGPGGAILDPSAVSALIAVWAQADNEDQIPANKLHNAGGGMGTDTDQVARASAMEALLAAQAATTTATANATAIAALMITANALAGHDNRTTVSAENPNATPPEGDLNTGDVHFQITTGGQFRAFQYNGATWDLEASLSGVGAALVIGLVSTWAIQGNTDDIPIGKLPFGVPSWILDFTESIPYSKLAGTLETWAVVDEVPPVQIIPNSRLPVARFLPAPTLLEDGIIAKIAGGQWVAAEEATLTGVAAKVWRLEYVDGNTLTGLGQEGKVFIRLRYLDTYNAAGTRTAVQDTGNAWLTAGGGRSISVIDALDIKALLAAATVPALMALVSSLPSASDATWGRFYGLGDGSAVDEISYRRRERTTSLIWGVERLQARQRNVHGFNLNGVNPGLLAGYSAGGSLSPVHAGITELVEERDVLGNVSIRAIVASDGLIGAPLGIQFYFREEGADDYAVDPIHLFFDATWPSQTTDRYASAEGGTFTFTPGKRYEIRFRNAGMAADLVLSEAQHMRVVADDDDVARAKAEVLESVYFVQDEVTAVDARVTDLEAPSEGGGFPTTRTEIFNELAAATAQNLTLSEDLLPNQLYELVIGASQRTRHIFLTVATVRNYDLAYSSPETTVEAATHTHAPYVFMTLRIGADTVTGFGLQEGHSLVSTRVRINKLT